MKTPEEEDVIIFEDVCVINYYEHEYICVFTLCIYVLCIRAHLFLCVNVYLFRRAICFCPTIAIYQEQ